MDKKSTKAKRQPMARKVEPVVGQFIFSELLGNFYVNAPGGEVIAMCSRRKVAEAIADAMNRSKGRTAKLMREGWTVDRDDQLYPPNPTGQAPARSAAEGR